MTQFDGLNVRYAAVCLRLRSGKVFFIYLNVMDEVFYAWPQGIIESVGR